MAQRSTLLARLEKEMTDLDDRLQIAKERVTRLEDEREGLAKALSQIRQFAKKSNASVTAMPGRKHTA